MTRSQWEESAESFDQEYDHGLTDPSAQVSWGALLDTLVPAVPQRILDMGCGTGSLSVLLAEKGHQVVGVDYSPAMLQKARAKAAVHQVEVDFQEGDAATWSRATGVFDTVLTRHLLWAVPDPKAALSHWRGLLGETGQLILIEGFWHTGVGLTLQETLKLVDDQGMCSTSRMLTGRALWGKDITDERYVVVGTLQH